MIYASLQFLASQLSLHLRRTCRLQEDVAIVSRLVENDGSSFEGAENKLVLFLASVEKDSFIRGTSASCEVDDFRNVIPSKKVYLNMRVVLSANFKGANYPESLKLLSKAVSFFQDHAVFDRSFFPDLNEGIEKLMVDIENLSLQDLNSLWGVVGTKYVPSVVYKVRTIALGSGYSYNRPYVVRIPEDAELGVV